MHNISQETIVTKYKLANKLAIKEKVTPSVVISQFQITPLKMSTDTKSELFKKVGHSFFRATFLKNVTLGFEEHTYW